MSLSELKKGDRVIVLDSWNNPVASSVVDRVTKTRIILEGENAFLIETGRCYGKAPRGWERIAIPTPELEEQLSKVLEKKAYDRKLAQAQAKRRLYDLIDYMQISYYGRLSDEQLFKAVAALEEILPEVKR